MEQDNSENKNPVANEMSTTATQTSMGGTATHDALGISQTIYKVMSALSNEANDSMLAECDGSSDGSTPPAPPCSPIAPAAQRTVDPLAVRHELERSLARSSAGNEIDNQRSTTSAGDDTGDVDSNAIDALLGQAVIDATDAAENAALSKRRDDTPIPPGAPTDSNGSGSGQTVGAVPDAGSEYNASMCASMRSIGSLVCRICHNAEHPERLVSPCYCKGSLTYVHIHCLERWISTSRSTKCELCQFQYNTEQTLRYTCIQSLRLWYSRSMSRRALQEDCQMFSLLTLVAFGIVGTLLAGVQYYIMQDNIWGLSKLWTKGWVILFLVLTLGVYFANIYMIVKSQLTPWYRWWQSSRDIKLILENRRPFQFRPHRRLHSRATNQSTHATAPVSEIPVTSPGPTLVRSENVSGQPFPICNTCAQSQAIITDLTTRPTAEPDGGESAMPSPSYATLGTDTSLGVALGNDNATKANDDPNQEKEMINNKDRIQLGLTKTRSDGIDNNQKMAAQSSSVATMTALTSIEQPSSVMEPTVSLPGLDGQSMTFWNYQN